MATQVQFNAFNFKSSQVRVITDPTGEFWFCGSDVCNILSYNNAPDALKKHCKEKGIAKRYTPTKGGNQEMIYINEPNLYRLIIKSRKPEAEQFEAWVFEEVLPQIRKTGGYSQNQQQILPLTKEPTFSKELTREQWLHFASFWFCFYNNLELMSKLVVPLTALGSHYGDTAYTHVSEYQHSIREMQRQLLPMLAEFDVDPYEHPHYHKALTTLRTYKPKKLGNMVAIYP